MMLHSSRCLIIPDVHQNVAWVERIFAQEEGYEHVVFLGDYFDARLSGIWNPGVRATCAYVVRKWRELGPRGVFLLGNHDIQYLEAKPFCDLHRTPRRLYYRCGGAYTHSTARKVAKGLPTEFWDAARLAVGVNGWLLSHAGVAAPHWPGAGTTEASLTALANECQTALQNMKRGPHPLLEAGRARGGDASIGGVTWMDWDEEFVDALPCPQIVGHTSDVCGARQKGRSWCIDGRQSCYGVLTPDGLSVKRC